ncbi:type II secretion system minor pseudopilin GspJ [Hyphomonas sp.]|uniref:type II secretion system minor pseudopilin GspJ n=1 Tax=Hyphomonas sp. TaxID=87 RepID=UPI003918DBCA
MSQYRHFSQSGVTLIETLVALFVIAIMATAGAIMTSQAVRGARVVEAKGGKSTSLSIAAGMIRDDLGAIVLRPSQDEVRLEPPTLFEGYAPRHDGRVMAFVRNGWANTSGEARGNLQRVEYRYARGALVRDSWSTPDPVQGSPASETVVLAGVSGLSVRYARGDRWLTEWVSLAGGNVPIPQKAELTFRFAPEEELKLLVLVGDGR